MKRLSPETIAKIVELYNQGTSAKAIGTMFNIAPGSVSRLINHQGEERTQHVIVSQQKVDQIIKEYLDGTSSEIIAAKLNINASTVCRILKRNGIAIRPATQNKRRYQIREDFFENIDTEDKAYFLGLMYADGHMSRGNGVHIGLKEADRHILEVFSNIIYGFVKLDKSNHTLDSGTIAAYYTLSFYGQKIADDLKRWGCTCAKSFTITFPQNLPSDMYSHFIRGYFDGDGCVSLETDGKVVVDITSCSLFLEGLQKFLEANLGIKIMKLHRRHKDRDTNTRNIQLASRENVIKFMDYLYSGATIYFYRKHDLYQQCLKHFQNRDDKKLSKHTNIDKYGTTYIPEWNGKILNAKNVEALTMLEKEQVAAYLFDFYRENGFPHAKLSDNDLIKDIVSLKDIDPLSAENDKTISTYHQSGLNIFKHFSPHFYEATSGIRDRKLSMLDTFNDDDLLKQVIKNRLDGNFNMTGSMLKQGLYNSKVAYRASIFNPIVAKCIYSKFIKDNDIVYDYSMGFGQRLTAALSLPQPLTYVGVDPMQRSVDSNSAIFEFFRKSTPLFNKKAEIVCAGSENYCDPKYVGRVSLAFSCPPYFNVERYEDDAKQAYFNNNYTDFINIWWRKTVQNVIRLLKNDGIFALDIKERIDGFNIGEDMCNVLREYGMKLIDTYQVQLTRNTVYGGANGEFKYEPIYIFSKDTNVIH